MEETGTGRVGWRVDDRPLSWWTRVYVLGMRLRRDKPAFAGAGHTRAAALERRRAGRCRPATRW